MFHFKISVSIQIQFFQFQFIEFVGAEQKSIRLNSVTELIETLKKEMATMYYSIALKTIGYAEKAGAMHTLCDADGTPKYALHLVDVMSLIKNPVENQFGVFLVPQGRYDKLENYSFEILKF